MDFYGTIGPACAELSTLQQMVRAGMTGLRMNLSHGSLAEHADWLELIQKAGIRTLLIDLQGPELRIGRLASPLTLSEGQQVFLGTGGIPCPACLLDAITPGQKLLLDDGKLLLRVNAVDTALHCTVLRGGLLQSRKSIAVPGVEVSSPTLTDEDLQNLRVAAGCGLEVVDVNRLLKQFEMMQDLVKQMTRGRMPKGLGGFGGKGGMSRMHGFGRKKRFK